MDDTSRCGRCGGVGEHDGPRKPSCAGEGGISRDGATDCAQDSTADGTGDGETDCAQDGTANGTEDGASEGMRDGAADDTLDTAWDKAEGNDTDVECDVDWRWGVVKAYWVSNVCPFIARLCTLHRCDRADFALMSGPNKGAFLLPEYHGKCFMI